jgi:regulator of sirC expression with transglutaminase-like and TPR domain
MNQPQENGPGAENFRQEFARIIARPEEDLDLGRAALVIAGEEYPGLDVDQQLQLLDGFASTVRERVSVGMASEDRAIQMGNYLFGEMGFRGNTADYYNPDNSYFNRVLQTRTGIPITLSLLFIEVGRRLGMRFRGVGMPGHFLVNMEGTDNYFDPFNAGQLLSVLDCQHLGERLFGPRFVWDDQYLEPCTKYEFLFRILNNLKVVYERTDQPEKALGAVQRMVMVRPDAVEMYQDMAALQQHLQQYRAAIVTLQRYLELRKDAPDSPQVRSWIDSLRVTLRRLN